MPCYRTFIPGLEMDLSMGFQHLTNTPFKAMFNISINYLFFIAYFQRMLQSNLAPIYPKI